MMKFRMLGFLLPMVAVTLTFSQGERLNYEEIQHQISDPHSVYYYPKLLQKYTANDTTLAEREYKMLYYGYTFQDAYNPYELPPHAKKFDKLLIKKKFKKSIKFGQKVLTEQPFNLRYLLRMTLAYSEAGMEEESKIYNHKVVNITRAILQTGDGTTCASAISMNSEADEYFIMQLEGIEYTSRSQTDECDHFITESGNDRFPKGIYFDIRRPLQFMARTEK